MQAEKFRSKAQKTDQFRSSQQYCRYLYYLGRIHTIQLEYTDAKECLSQVCVCGGVGQHAHHSARLHGHQGVPVTLCVCVGGGAGHRTRHHHHHGKNPMPSSRSESHAQQQEPLRCGASKGHHHKHVVCASNLRHCVNLTGSEECMPQVGWSQAEVGSGWVTARLPAWESCPSQPSIRPACLPGSPAQASQAARAT